MCKANNMMIIVKLLYKGWKTNNLRSCKMVTSMLQADSEVQKNQKLKNN